MSIDAAIAEAVAHWLESSEHPANSGIDVSAGSFRAQTRAMAPQDVDIVNRFAEFITGEPKDPEMRSLRDWLRQVFGRAKEKK